MKINKLHEANAAMLGPIINALQAFLLFVLFV